MSIVLRLLATLASLAIAAFCVFGFLASFEPGVGPVWKIGYAVVFVVALLGAAVAWLGRARP
jgi:hypothetical protein